MSQRQNVPQNVQRKLWAESLERCMNPNCNILLISDDCKTSIADMAHIEPHSEGGEVSADNLILLCKNCHKLHEPLDKPEKKDELRRWKMRRKEECEKLFAREFKTFEELSLEVKPILEENHRIFSSYGPHTNDPEAFELWKHFENKLIVNNAKLKLLFSTNIELFDDTKAKYNNRKSISHFIAHVDEFAGTRNRFEGKRRILFPVGILSIFGFDQKISGVELKNYTEEQDINNIESVIKDLQEKGNGVKLYLDYILRSDSCIIYSKDGKSEKVRLNDTPRVRQHIFNAKRNGHEHHNTDLPLESLQFFLKVTSETRAKWLFDDFTDLTLVTVDEKKVRLLFLYRLSIASLQSVDSSSADYFINLNQWGPKITEEALSYAKDAGIRVVSLKYFLSLCHKNQL